MTSPFHEIISFEEDGWQEFLERICLIDIFKPVIERYRDAQTLKCVIRYIVYCYSRQSDKVIIGMDWQKNKKQIFEFIMIPPKKEFYDELVLLKSEEVLQSIYNWLSFQDQETWTQLMVLKDLRVEMQISANSKILKPSSEIDYSQKFLNAEYSNKLKLMIKDLESELIQNDMKLKDSVKEITAKRGNKNTLHLEKFAK